MLRKKPYVENHKREAEKKLAERLEILKSRGMSEAQIERDSAVKHCKAEIRKARRQLASIASLELQIAQQAEIKAQKLAAPKTEPPKVKKSAPDPTKKRAKKEKKIAAEAVAAEE